MIALGGVLAGIALLAIGGFIGEGHINWQGPNGVAYSVSG